MGTCAKRSLHYPNRAPVDAPPSEVAGVVSPSPAAEPTGLRAELTLRLAFFCSSSGERLARRCALCRHLEPQNRAVERRGVNVRRQTAHVRVFTSVFW